MLHAAAHARDLRRKLRGVAAALQTDGWQVWTRGRPPRKPVLDQLSLRSAFDIDCSCVSIKA